MLVALNKPFGVLCQFTDEAGRRTLADFVPQKGVYAAGRLDHDLRDDTGQNSGRDRPHPHQQFRAFVEPAAEPEPEHPPDLVGKYARDQQDQQRMPIADEVAHARAFHR